MCVFQLAMKSDILLENYIPGKLAEMGLGYEQLSRLAPQLVYCSITGPIVTPSLSVTLSLSITPSVFVTPSLSCSHSIPYGVFSSHLMLRVSYCDHTPSSVRPVSVNPFTYSNNISSETTGFFIQTSSEASVRRGNKKLLKVTG